MVTVTAPNNVRCSLRPESILAVTGGAPTTVLLTNGLSLEVRESVEEVQRRLDQARRANAPAPLGRRSHGR
ncbi:MAG: flagellar FlbD family protein [Candidatus Rokubacteria bacterium]|nr:flagellar FlbD family protein [Candidatus Rokubacteria bacterium]